MTLAHLVAYFVPALPIVTRLILCLRWMRQISAQLSEGAQERDLQRTFILSLAGFSFTAVAALAVLDAAVRITLQLPTWYVLLSFVAYVSALNANSYKSNRWQNQVATALVEVGTLSLMLALVALIFNTSFAPRFQWIAGAITIGAWLVDHLIRLSLDYRYLAERDMKVPNEEIIHAKADREEGGK